MTQNMLLVANNRMAAVQDSGALVMDFSVNTDKITVVSMTNTMRIRIELIVYHQGEKFD